MSAEITRAEIETLRYFDQIAFAAQCVEIAWGIVFTPNFPKPPERLNEAFEAVRKWRRQIKEGKLQDIMTLKTACEEGSPRRSPVNEERWKMIQELLRKCDSNERHSYGIAQAIKAAIMVVITLKGSRPQDDAEADERTMRAYEAARGAGRIGGFTSDFDQKAREAFDQFENLPKLDKPS